MKFFLLLIILFNLSFQITSIKELNFQKSNNKISKTLVKMLLSSIIYEFGVKIETLNACFEATSYETIISLIDYSGKSIGEIGNEQKCVEIDNFIYFLYLFQIDYAKIGDKDDKKEKLFIGNNTYFWGLCLTKQCIEPFLFLFNNDNVKFNSTIIEFNTISAKILISRKNNSFLKYNKFIDRKYQIDNQEENYYTNRQNIYDILSYFITFYLIIILVFTFLKMIFFFSQNETNEKDILDVFDDSYQFDLNYSNTNKTYKSNIFFNKEIINQEINIKKNTKIIKYLSYFELLKNNSLFLSFSNKYYNGSFIELIGFIRMIIMFFIVFKYIFLASSNIFFQTDIINMEIYQSFLFIFVKLSFFSSISWIILDGALFGFKLYSFIQRNEKKHKTYLVTILKFYIYLIPKILVFFIIYFYFDVLCFYNNDSNILKNYYVYLKQQYQCFKNPFEIFFPFVFFKSDINNFNNYHKQCYVYTFILINEFYSIIILSIIVFISYKLKSKIFDYIITFVFIINLFTIQLFYNKEQYMKKYKYIEMNIFFGQKFYEKNTHLFISIFFLGFLVGNVIFYYHHVVSSTYISKEFLPFSFTIYIMNKFNNLELLTKNIISFFLSFILIFISYIPLFVKKNFGEIMNEKENLGNQSILNLLLNIDIYEKVIFSIIFCILLIFLKLILEHSILSYFLESKFIFSFEKIKIVFFCYIETFLYSSFIIFNFKFNFTYRNLIYITIGLYVLAYIFSYIITLLFEFPIIKIIKYFTKHEKIKISQKEINKIDSKIINE